MNLRARILKPNPASIALASEALRNGDVVGMPTETVYGLAGNALDEQALARIFATKERPTFDPLIVHVGMMAKSIFALSSQQGLVDLKALSSEAIDRAEKLIQNFWPGPLTLVLPKSPRVPDLATSGLPSVAIRMPRHPVAQSLIAAAGVPLAAPSANRFGRISPTSATAVLEELGDRIDFILDGGSCEIGLESTVVRVENSGELTLLRPGGIPAEKIEAVTGAKLQRVAAVAELEKEMEERGMAAPGMLKSHYAPLKPLYLLPKPLSALASREELPSPPEPYVGLLAFSGNEKELQTQFSKLTGSKVTVHVLSPSGDAGEAARNLFRGLRDLDSSVSTVLYAEPCPSREGLGHAIADRLSRAALNGSQETPKA